MKIKWGTGRWKREWRSSQTIRAWDRSRQWDPSSSLLSEGQQPAAPTESSTRFALHSFLNMSLAPSRSLSKSHKDKKLNKNTGGWNKRTSEKRRWNVTLPKSLWAFWFVKCQCYSQAGWRQRLWPRETKRNGECESNRQTEAATITKRPFVL